MLFGLLLAMRLSTVVLIFKSRRHTASTKDRSLVLAFMPAKYLSNTVMAVVTKVTCVTAVANIVVASTREQSAIRHDLVSSNAVSIDALSFFSFADQIINTHGLIVPAFNQAV